MEICVQVSTQALWVYWRAADDMFNVEGSTEASHPVAIYVFWYRVQRSFALINELRTYLKTHVEKCLYLSLSTIN